MNNAPYSEDFQRAFFDEFADFYDHVDHFSLGIHKAACRRSLKLLNIREGSHCCDLMCGTGINTRLLLEKYSCKRISAIDISVKMLAKLSGKENKGIVHTLQQSALLTSLPDNSVDHLICTLGIKSFVAVQHLQLLKEIRRILKPGGNFVLIELSVPESIIPRLISRFYFKYFMDTAGLLLGKPMIRRKHLWNFIASFRSSKALQPDVSALFPNHRYIGWYAGIITGFAGEKTV